MTTSFVGTWDTTWQSSDGGWHPDFTLTVTESFRVDPPGSVLHGMYDLRDRPGKMYGTLSGNRWEGTWENSPTEKGNFTFNLGAAWKIRKELRSLAISPCGGVPKCRLYSGLNLRYGPRGLVQRTLLPQNFHLRYENLDCNSPGINLELGHSRFIKLKSLKKDGIAQLLPILASLS